ncbi:conserved Plasmodium protein, unknown function [Plasmodium berghei]|uniref:Uncharacterized protein n=2 Tax=Plasmodium berghei TaxID=5821 RepID=A0A509AMN3_PLABA|nr:conserved Plasmodium protein, unknown function [Plasmodium berghei ANKA]CXI50694.1 conserved Plasmodium protein, unknown function [Plasmodium berghei]SCL94307.1 conserved Plasmodium protein, unknown function [Plasmodium berghei]SCM15986.1 conserved Plasmodium protein, unknown function [Plasmodium berghei]SCM17782.1 conserved Plasmodium protein, unknown function [Plasmodium berghei]SCN26013.1 conserved Plasmodium protein, unknown function [Plasmodium berghei]|eukprot:XP_034421911.1 conserved Plasmodium protein, unknown function [Plasmodium berghei ANKA]
MECYLLILILLLILFQKINCNFSNHKKENSTIFFRAQKGRTKYIKTNQYSSKWRKIYFTNIVENAVKKWKKLKKIKKFKNNYFSCSFEKRTITCKIITPFFITNIFLKKKKCVYTLAKANPFNYYANCLHKKNKHKWNIYNNYIFNLFNKISIIARKKQKWCALKFSYDNISSNSNEKGNEQNSSETPMCNSNIKCVLTNILKNNFIYNYPKKDELNKLVTKITCLFYKLNKYNYENKNNVALNIWGKPINIISIKACIDNILNCLSNNKYNKEDFLNNNIFFKYENEIEKKLFFHLQYFYSVYIKYIYQKEKLFYELNENNREINSHINNVFIYLYDKDDANVEEFYEYLKNIYGEDVVSFFNYKRYIHNDNKFSIILLSYNEFLKLCFLISQNEIIPYNNLRGYLKNDGIYSSQKNINSNNVIKNNNHCENFFVNLRHFFSSLIDIRVNKLNDICEENGHKRGYYKCKFFFDNFSLKYNYENNVMEKNIYENIFSLLNLNEKQNKISFNFLCNDNFNLKLFQFWIASVHNNCMIINFSKEKNTFLLHKKYILKLGNKNFEDEHIPNTLRHNYDLSNYDKNFESLILSYIKNRKKNNVAEKNAENLSIFNNYRKKIIIKYLKEHNLYNLNKLKKKSSDIKRNINIAKKIVKKKKKKAGHAYSFNISDYLNFIINNKKKGSIFLKKNIINPFYIEKKENLQSNDKAKILSKNINIVQNSLDISEKSRLSNNKNKNDYINKQFYYLYNPHSVKQNIHTPIEKKNRSNFKTNYINIQYDQCDEDKQLWTQNTSNFSQNFKDNLEKYNNSKRDDEKRINNIVEIYPCIYYIFNKVEFLSFSKNLYTIFKLINKEMCEKLKDKLKKYNQTIIDTKNENILMFIKYLYKGIFLINTHLNDIEKKFLTELIKNNIVKIVLSCIDISSYNISVSSIFVEDFQIYNKNKLNQYNLLINKINQLHEQIFVLSQNCERKKSIIEIQNNVDDNYMIISDDMYRLHFIKYFMFLNFRKIFPKYTLSNNNLQNFSKNSTNYFLIPKRYEDIPIILNINNNSYLNLSNFNKVIINDFYFNLYYDNICKGIFIKLKKIKDVIKGKILETYIDNINKLAKYDILTSNGKKKNFNFFDNKIVEEKHPQYYYTIFKNLIKNSYNIHKMYKHKKLNETILINSYMDIYNNVSYNLNYFDVLYLFFMKEERLDLISDFLKNCFFNFYLMQREKYEKKYIKYDKYNKLNIYSTYLEKINKYFDNDYLTMYYNTYLNYRKLKKKIRQKLRNLYEEKYKRLEKQINNMKKNNFKNKVFITINNEKCIVIDCYDLVKKRENNSIIYSNYNIENNNSLFHNKNTFICFNDKSELIVCNASFFSYVIYDKNKYDSIKSMLKDINYYNYLFEKRKIETYEIFIKENIFKFSIPKIKTKNQLKKCLTIRQKKKIIKHAKINRIYIYNIQKNENNKINDIQKKKKFISSINIDNLFLNSYDEQLYQMKNNLLLYFEKMKKIKLKLYMQYFHKKKNIKEKRKEGKNIQRNDEVTHPIQHSTINENMVFKKKIISLSNVHKKKKYILRIKFMKNLNILNKKKNSGNKNVYMNELNKLNRILGNTYNHQNVMDQFYDIFYFLKKNNLINILKNYINPYIKNTMWYYIITQYINNAYQLNINQLNFKPELIIIIFYICFSKKETDYLDNYLSSLEIKDNFLKQIVSDIYIYKELLTIVQSRYNIRIDIQFNLYNINDIYDGLIKLKINKYDEISKNVEANLNELNLILYNILSTNFNKRINNIILDFINEFQKYKKYKYI